ncbi:hypothetical protein GCM10027403_20040 [Arthrobacter tecti]
MTVQRRLVGAAALLAVVVLSGCSPGVGVRPSPPYFEPVAVELEPGDVFPMLTLYGGWWSTLADSSESAGYPAQATLIRPESGEYLGGYDRRSGMLVPGEDILPLEGWPADVVLVIDPATGIVWDQFHVDENGLPIEAESGAVSVERRFPTIAGDPPPGTFHTFVQNEFTGAVIYVGIMPEESLDAGRVGVDW